eukprot:XP_001708939.1 Hypothetical protein GL50803_39457 [Giardia lamblia ATCC 50803]
MWARLAAITTGLTQPIIHPISIQTLLTDNAVRLRNV